MWQSDWPYPLHCLASAISQRYMYQPASYSTHLPPQDGRPASPDLSPGPDPAAAVQRLWRGVAWRDGSRWKSARGAERGTGLPLSPSHARTYMLQRRRAVLGADDEAAVGEGVVPGVLCPCEVHPPAANHSQPAKHHQPSSGAFPCGGVPCAIASPRWHTMVHTPHPSALTSAHARTPTHQ